MRLISLPGAQTIYIMILCSSILIKYIPGSGREHNPQDNAQFIFIKSGLLSHSPVEAQYEQSRLVQNVFPHSENIVKII